MKRAQTLRKSISYLTGMALLVLAWIYLTPVQLGGQTVYLVISGISMEPTFYEGDLVLLHRTGSYQVGDAAAYYVPGGGIVIHRIIAQNGERFILLGDNKPSPDTYRPILSEMVGKYWLHIPMLGRLVRWYAGQEHALTTEFVLAGLGALMLIPKAKKKPTRKQPHSKKEQPELMSQFYPDKTNKADLAVFLITFLVLSTVLTFLAFSRPLTRTATDSISYEQQGAFSYTALAPPGIYDSDIVRTGEPIFRALINRVKIDFEYEFVSSDSARNMAGAYRIDAEIGHSNGWSSIIELIPETSFNEKGFSVSMVLDLSQVQRLLDNLEQQTGLGGQQYILTILPQVEVTGVLHQEVVEENFSPRLVFDLDAVQMKLASDRSAKSETPAANSLKPSQPGQVEEQRETPNSFSVFSFDIPVSLVRQLGLVGTIVSLCGLIMLGVTMFRAYRAGEAARIQFKYGGHLTPIQKNRIGETEDLVEMATIDDLVRLAEREGRPILHYANRASHHYLVKDGVTTYRYVVDQAGIGRDEREIKQVQPDIPLQRTGEIQ